MSNSRLCTDHHHSRPPTSSSMFQNLRDQRKKLKAAIKGVVSRPSSPMGPSGSGAQQEVGLALHTPMTSRSPSQNLSSPATVQAHNISPRPTEPATVSVQSQSSVDVPAIVIDPPRASSVAADAVSPDSRSTIQLNMCSMSCKRSLYPPSMKDPTPRTNRCSIKHGLQSKASLRDSEQLSK